MQHVPHGLRLGGLRARTKGDERGRLAVGGDDNKDSKNNKDGMTQKAIGAVGAKNNKDGMTQKAIIIKSALIYSIL